MLKFETAALADTIKRAASVAPTKGAAFDQANGIYLAYNPVEGRARVMATDLMTYFSERINVLDGPDEPVIWRLPAAPFAAAVTNLPLGGGQAVTIEKEGTSALLKCERRKVSLRSSDPSTYPLWDEFDTDGMEKVSDFAQKVAQVGWAADKVLTTVRAGVHLDGEHAIATDTYRIAWVPCPFPVQKPVTVALSALSGIVRPGQESTVRATERGLQVTIDDHIQVMASVFSGEFPKVQNVLDSHLHKLGRIAKVNRSRMDEVVNQMVSLIQNKERSSPNMIVNLASNTALLKIVAPDVGEIEDIVDIDYAADPFEFDVTPSSIQQALTNGTYSEIEMCVGDHHMQPIWLKHLGYNVLMMPRDPEKARKA